MATNLVVEAGEAAFVLGDQKWLEAALAIARHLDSQRAVLGLHGLGRRAVAVVGRLGGLARSRRVAQVVRRLAAQRALNDGLLQRHLRHVDLLGRHLAI
jgi:hypothetical protein